MKIVFLFSIVLILCISGYSQNGNVGIGTTSPLARLHVVDSSVVFSASGEAPLSAHNPPINNEGRRMFWYADKAAFRSGYVASTNWNKENIGLYSVGLGYNNLASGEVSTSLGYFTAASGWASTALGNLSDASGYVSTAMGESTHATGYISTAMGYKTNASGFYSTSMGYQSNASGIFSTAMGINSLAQGYGSTAMGDLSIAKAKFSTAIGERVQANAYASIALGHNNDTIVTVSDTWIPSEPLLIVGNGLSYSEKRNAMVMLKNGNTGFGVNNPNAKLSISTNGNELAGSATGNVLTTNAGTLSSAVNSEMSLANIGFMSSNNSSLAVRAYRTVPGSDWYTTSLLLEYDVDNTARAGGAFLAICGNGNVGISTVFPQARLDVNGTTKTNSLMITNGGNSSDFLMKNDASGQVSFRKGYVGLGLNYIIAVEGTYPSQSPPQSQGPMIGEIKIFAGNSPPYGWLFCQGQLLLVTDYPNLFNVIGTTYGGNGQNNFALPDLRSAIPVGEGSAWLLGERSN